MMPEQFALVAVNWSTNIQVALRCYHFAVCAMVPYVTTWPISLATCRWVVALAAAPLAHFPADGAQQCAGHYAQHAVPKINNIIQNCFNGGTIEKEPTRGSGLLFNRFFKCRRFVLW